MGRIIQLKNNYYIDKDGAGFSGEMVPGEYCCLGYFDALNILPFNQDNENIYSVIEQQDIFLDSAHGRRRTMVCFCESWQEEERFWGIAKEYPYLLISIVRIAKNEFDRNALDKLLQKVCASQKTMYYYSFDQQAEIIFANISSSYKGLLTKIEDIIVYLEQNNIHVMKSYSIFSVHEECLDSTPDHCNPKKEELVRAHFHVFVKKRDKIKDYFSNLATEMGIKGILYGQAIGRTDIHAVVESISLPKLLCFYASNGLLNHDNNLYKEIFYNIETELLSVNREGEWYCA